MQKSKSYYLLAAIMIASFGSASSFAQQPALTEKQSLILEFRKLTGADTVDGSIDFSSESIQQVFTSMIEQDNELIDAQRAELRKFAAEATNRIDKIARDSLLDKSQIMELSEKVINQIYDKSFTESELKEIIAFYRTPTGQKVGRFLATLSSQVQKEFGEVVQAKLTNILQPQIQIEIAQLKQKIKDIKVKKGAN